MSDKVLTEAFDKLKAIEEGDPEFSTVSPRKKQFVVSIAWTQTDHENVLVSANSRNDAEEIVNRHFPSINHITGISEINIRL